MFNKKIESFLWSQFNQGKKNVKFKQILPRDKLF